MNKKGIRELFCAHKMEEFAMHSRFNVLIIK